MTHNRAEPTLAHHAPGRRSSGFAITIESARPFYVRLCADETWCWTADCHEAELFPSEERAAAWAARNIGGGKPKVVGVML